MSETTKRVRSSQRRDHNLYTALGEITSAWHNAVKFRTPIGIVFRDVVSLISRADVTQSDRLRLSHANWASRDLVERGHAEWCLYIGTERVNGQSERYSDPALAGRFEWRGTGLPFFDNEDPELLNKPKAAHVLV